MNRSINFIGVDVDDKSFHGYVVNNATKTGKAFVCRPTAAQLIKKLNEFKGSNVELKVCYEATYIGFALHRALKKAGFNCVVIAPSHTPRIPGKKVKTDRIDAKKLASFYMNSQLTEVHIPTEEEEIVRDLVRSRRFFSTQLKALKLHILATCRRLGLRYNERESKKSYWTQNHITWLEAQAKKFSNNTIKINMKYLLNQLKLYELNISTYNEEIEKIASSGFYREIVGGLCCYRGINILTAMTLITELGDIKRFNHPRKLCSYAGLDIREYSSGGHERRYGITKMGNKHIRTSVIESCQTAWNIPKISKRLKASRQGVNNKYLEIADRCMHRLYKKSHRLLHRGKEKNKVKVACAREMLCFVWETMQATV
ncbi:MAG: IS110 family transposase [bacterium]